MGREALNSLFTFTNKENEYIKALSPCRNTYINNETAQKHFLFLHIGKFKTDFKAPMSDFNFKFGAPCGERSTSSFFADFTPNV